MERKMTLSPKYLLPGTMMMVALCAAVWAATPEPSQAAQQGAPHQAARKTAASATHAEQDGERIFDQNCSRCHATPEGFPPSISGTIVRHMRVRASLSEKQEKELLRYLNP